MMTAPTKSPAEQIREWGERMEALDLRLKENPRDHLAQLSMIASARTELPRARRVVQALMGMIHAGYGGTSMEIIATERVAAILRGEGE